MLVPMFEDCESCETCDIKHDCDEIRKYCLSKREKREETLNLCSYCKEEFAECNGDPKFGIGKGNDNVYECKQFNQE